MRMEMVEGSFHEVQHTVNEERNANSKAEDRGRDGSQRVTEKKAAEEKSNERRLEEDPKKLVPGGEEPSRAATTLPPSRKDCKQASRENKMKGEKGGYEKSQAQPKNSTP